jgi:CubicO group peptidase (beta-lactamase class C family)
MGSPHFLRCAPGRASFAIVAATPGSYRWRMTPHRRISRRGIAPAGKAVAVLVALALAGLAVWTGAASSSSRAPATAVPAHRFDAARLARVETAFQETIDQGKMAGAVVYVARDGVPVLFKAYGRQDIEAGKPMPTDAVFRIASMSKAVTTTAVMMLYEEGRFLLHDPVSKFIPGFKDSVVAVAPPEGSPPDTPYSTEPAKRGITILDLITHTAGLTYGDGPAVADYKKANLHGWYFADHNETIGEAIDRLATLPLHGQPGEAWQYGFATDVLGRLVEVVSGQPLDRFFEERIFKPLDMRDSCFFLPPEKAGRLAPVYGLEDGKLMLKETSATSDYVHGPRKCFSGGAGLLSTAHDYGRFLQMLLNGGELDGARLLGPKTVELMRSNLVGTRYPQDSGAFGAGFWVLQDLGYYGELGSEGSYGWGSAYYPIYLVDPQERLVALFLTQLRPAGALDLNRRFRVLLYQALVE